MSEKPNEQRAEGRKVPAEAGPEVQEHKAPDAKVEERKDDGGTNLSDNPAFYPAPGSVDDAM